MIYQGNRLSDTPMELWGPETEISAMLGARSVVWTGRAATALAWAYRIARHAGDPADTPEIIVPAISCVSPAAAVVTSGCAVRFADADLQTGMITLESVQDRWTPATRAVVFIHLYGQTADLEPMAAWCRSRGVILIEDLAQAQGAKLPNGKPAGSVGDLAVYSFNRTKILECGGGALVLRSQRLTDTWRELAQREPSNPEIGFGAATVLSSSQRNLYQSLVSLRRMRSVRDVSDAYLSVYAAYSALYVRSMQSPAAVAAAWGTLSSALEARGAKASLYSSKLAHGPWRLLEGWRSSGVCWRYSLLVNSPEQLVPFTEAVRRDGFYVSNLYWPLNELMNPRDYCPNAEAFARRIMNLWVDDAVTPEWVERCCASLNAHAVDYAGEA